MRNNRSLIVVVSATAWAASALPSFAQNAFTYQGRIKVDGIVPTGTTYDFTFSLWDDPDPGQGTKIGSTNSFDNLAVTNGLFVADLDFGAEAFNDLDQPANQRWLEITVTTTTGSTTLPRQPITATPFSLATRGITVDDAGNVGIGTTEPQDRLSVAGNADFIGNVGIGKQADGNPLLITNTNTVVHVGAAFEAAVGSTNQRRGSLFYNSQAGGLTTGGFDFQDRDDSDAYVKSLLTILKNGNVGIGTTSPGTTLEVSSSISSIVSTTGSHTSGYSIIIPDGSSWAWQRRPDVGGDNNDLKLLRYIPGNIYQGIAMQIQNSTGNVGIGTSEPGTRLQVNAGSGNFGDGGTLGFASTDNAPFAMIGGTLHVNSGGEEQGDLFFSTRPVGPPGQVLTERVRILRDGSVGIGTTAPSTILHVAGDLTVDGLCGTCSDSRFKTNVAPLREALTTLARLTGIGFDWDRAAYPDRGFTDRHQIGFIAQQIREVLPEVVNEGGDGYLSVDYGKLTPVLVEGVKELHGIVQAQESKIADLEARLAKMEDLMGAKEFVGR